MTKTLLAAACASLLLGAWPAAAETAAPLPLAGDAPAVTLVSGGCGPAFHRGPFGGCRPNFFRGRGYGYRGYGYGYRPYAYHRGFY